jgi:hypothetical protein
MGKVVDFLARAGSDAALRHAPADAVDAALLEAAVDDEDFRDALTAQDGEAVRALLGQREYFVSQMPDGPPHEEQEDPLDGDEEEGDSEPDGSVSHVPPVDPKR